MSNSNETQNQSDWQRITSCVKALEGIEDPAEFVKNAQHHLATITDQDKQLSLLRGENAKLKEEIQESDKEAEEWERAAIMAEAKYNAAQQENAKLREALDRIKNQEEYIGREGCTYLDTVYDSISAQQGFNDALKICQEIAAAALSTLQGETKDGWIRTDKPENLPTKNCPVHIWDPNNPFDDHQCIAKFDAYQKCFFLAGADTIHPTYYRPLPSAPKDGESLLTNNK